MIGRACQWWIGDWLNFGEGAGYIGRKSYDEAEALFPHFERRTLSAFAEVARKCPIRMGDLTFGHHQVVAPLDPAEQKHWLEEAVEHGWSVAELRSAIKSAQHKGAIAPPEGTYSTLVVDPPWPMEKIEREVRPNQAAPLDYPTMTEDELRAWPRRSTSSSRSSSFSESSLAQQLEFEGFTSSQAEYGVSKSYK